MHYDLIITQCSWVRQATLTFSLISTKRLLNKVSMVTKRVHRHLPHKRYQPLFCGSCRHGSIWVFLGSSAASGYSMSACCCIVCAAVVQLCWSQRCCLVTARWAGARIKCCRCVWGNLWRALEEGVSHSAWSSSRTESSTSHLLGVFYPYNTSLCLTLTTDTVWALKYK